MDDGPQDLIGVAADPILAAHDRLIAGDRVASEELVSLLLDPLVARLKRRWPRWAHTDVLYDAAVDVVLTYLETPERYNPSTGPLLRWLEVSAHGDLTNAYRSGRQRQAIELMPLSTVGDPQRRSEDLLDTATVTPIGRVRLAPDPANAERLDGLGVWRRIREACPDERERDLIWACWVEGERSTDELAKILGVENLPVDQLRRRVKNARDIARRKLQRLGLIDNDSE